MEKILELEFSNDVTLDEIYEELKHYKLQGIIATCKYKNFILSNENDHDLNFLFNRLKLNMSENEYHAYLEKVAKKKMDYDILSSMISAPKLLKYYVERGSIFLAESSQQDTFVLECYYWYGKNPEYFKSIKIASKLLEAVYTIEVNDDIALGYQLINRMMDDLCIADDFCIDIAEIIVKRVLKESSIKVVEDLLLYHESKERQIKYEKKLKMQYSKNKDK